MTRRPAGLYEHELLLLGVRLRFETLLLGRRELRLFGADETLRRRREKLSRLRLERLLLLLFLLLLSEKILRLLERERLLLLEELLLRADDGRRGRERGGGPLEVELDGPVRLELRLRERLERGPELRLRLRLRLRPRLELRRRVRLELRLRLSGGRQGQALADVDAGRLLGHLLEHDRVVLAGGRVEHQLGGVQRRVGPGRLEQLAAGRRLRQVSDGRLQVVSRRDGRSERRRRGRRQRRRRRGGRQPAVGLVQRRDLRRPALRLLLPAGRLARRGGRHRRRLRLFEVAERLLEQRGGRPVLLRGRRPGTRHVGRHVLLLVRTVAARAPRLLLVVVVVVCGRARVARVALHVRELALVAVRVHVAVLAADHAVRAARLLLEATVVRLVAERERPVVVELVVVADGLRGRLSLLLLLLRLRLLEPLLDQLLLLRHLRSRPLSDHDVVLRLLLLLRHVLVLVVQLLGLRSRGQRPGRLSDHHHRLSFSVRIAVLLLQRA